MKTIPVKEVAEALGISARGVLYRREKGHLKGVLIKNDRGVDEYRIYPTKEIIEGLRRIGSPLVASNEAIADFEVVDQSAVPEEDKVLDSTYGEDDIIDAAPTQPRKELTEENKIAANAVADHLWNGIIERFTEKLAAKDQLIGEMRADIAEKDRRLLLLPDHEAIKLKAEEDANKIADVERNRAETERKNTEEARRSAEEERKKAEAKELESEALKKQIAALQAQAAPELKKQLEAEKAAKERELKLLQAQLDDIRKAKEQEVRALEERLEKSSETASIKEQLTALSSKLEASQKPWWKKMFSGSGESGAN